jgi:hypothetical protein
MATYEQLSSALVKADAAGNVDDARAFAAEIRKLKTTSFEAPASRTNVRDESFLRSQLNKRILEPAAEVLATGQGVSKGIGDIMFGGQRLVGQGLQALGAQETGQALMQDAARRKAMEEANLAKYREAAPGAVPVGEFVGQTVATLPAGGLIGKGLQAVSPALAPLAQAVRTGGFSTGMASGVASRATQAAGGAILGGTSAALINPEETTTSAAIGAALPFALPFVGRFVATGGGKIIDAFSGRLAEVKAGKVAREMAGDAINTIRVANNVAPMDVNAAQAVGGVDNDVYQAFLDFYAGKDKTAFQRVLKDDQKLSQLNQLARLAGGSTETEVINNIGDAKRVLNNLTTPMRESVFGKVTETGQVMPALAKEAKALRKEAADKVAEVRRFVGQQVSEPTNVTPGLTMYGKNGLPINEVSVSPAAQARAITPEQDNLATDYLLGKLAGSADEVAGKAAFESLSAGAGARTAEAKLANMEAKGLQPLAGTTLAAQIDSIANQPGVRADDVQSKALLNLRDKIAKLSAPSNGLIDVEDAYQIRKTSINDAVIKALSDSGYDPKAQSTRLANLLTDVRGLIDDAIRKAGGGEDWNRYLETFSKGRGQLDQRLAAGQLLKILKQDPAKFVDIVKGNDTDFVEKIFGPGNRDLMQAMGGQRPNSPMVKLLGIADQAERDLGIKPQVKAGRKALNLEDQYGNPTELIPGFVGYKTAIAKKVAQMVTGKVNEKAQRLITEGVRSGKAMNEILNTLPAEERLKVVDLFRNNPDVQRAVSIGAVQYATPNALAPQQQNQNALAR